uniref:Uncharacterized protein n=1 Tax=Timema cristinae TaxID=61476 RepID=A0A7R9D361_TIMCR|nr:unnamed protein product [Timema cristinae]
MTPSQSPSPHDTKPECDLQSQAPFLIPTTERLTVTIFRRDRPYDSNLNLHVETNLICDLFAHVKAFRAKIMLLEEQMNVSLALKNDTSTAYVRSAAVMASKLTLVIALSLPPVCKTSPDHRALRRQLSPEDLTDNDNYLSMLRATPTSARANGRTTSRRVNSAREVEWSVCASDRHTTPCRSAAECYCLVSQPHTHYHHHLTSMGHDTVLISSIAIRVAEDVKEVDRVVPNWRPALSENFTLTISRKKGKHLVVDLSLGLPHAIHPAAPLSSSRVSFGCPWVFLTCFIRLPLGLSHALHPAAPWSSSRSSSSCLLVFLTLFIQLPLGLHYVFHPAVPWSFSRSSSSCLLVFLTLFIQLSLGLPYVFHSAAPGSFSRSSSSCLLVFLTLFIQLPLGLHHVFHPAVSWSSLRVSSSYLLVFLTLFIQLSLGLPHALHPAVSWSSSRSSSSCPLVFLTLFIRLFHGSLHTGNSQKSPLFVSTWHSQKSPLFVSTWHPSELTVTSEHREISELTVTSEHREISELTVTSEHLALSSCHLASSWCTLAEFATVPSSNDLEGPLSSLEVDAKLLSKYNSLMTSLVLTDSSQLRDDDFEKLPDKIMYPYAEPYDQQKQVFGSSWVVKAHTAIAMDDILSERAQQLFLLSDQERKGFIVKRDMQGRIKRQGN